MYYMYSTVGRSYIEAMHDLPYHTMDVFAMNEYCHNDAIFHLEVLITYGTSSQCSFSMVAQSPDYIIIYIPVSEQMMPFWQYSTRCKANIVYNGVRPN